MINSLVTKAQFAKMAGVSAAAVTKACRTRLAPAFDGKKIDTAHPAAVEYLNKQDGVAPLVAAEGIDSLYSEALAACRQSGRWSELFLRQQFKIGSGRAGKILAQMKSAGVYKRSAIGAVKAPAMKGQQLIKERKKAEPPPEVFDGTHPVPEHLEAFADMTLRQIVEKFGTDSRFVDWLKAAKSIEDIREKRIKNAAAMGELVNLQLVKSIVIDEFNTAHLRMLKDGAKSITATVIGKHEAGIGEQEITNIVSDRLGSFIAPAKRKIARLLQNGE